MTTSANVRQSLKKKKSRDVENCLKQTEMSFEPGMLKQQRWCKIVYQGIPSEFFCLKWAEWLSMCESYLAHLVGQLVYSEGWTCWSKAGHLPHTPTLLRPAPFHRRNSRKKKYCKIWATFSIPSWQMSARLRFTFERQQAADLSTSVTAWQPGHSLNLSHHLSPDTCT